MCSRSDYEHLAPLYEGPRCGSCGGDHFPAEAPQPPRTWDMVLEYEGTDVRRKAADRERKRLVSERDKRMSGNRRQQHVDNGLRRQIERARKRLGYGGSK